MTNKWGQWSDETSNRVKKSTRIESVGVGIHGQFDEWVSVTSGDQITVLIAAVAVLVDMFIVMVVVVVVVVASQIIGVHDVLEKKSVST